MHQTTKPRRIFSPEFKQQAVELALTNGNVLQTARELGIDNSNLRRWINASQQQGSTPFPGSGSPREKELAEMKKKLYDLEQENAILKKAVGIFTARPR